MKGIFEDGKSYRIQEKGSSSGFTWCGGLTAVYVDDYWTMERYLQDF